MIYTIQAYRNGKWDSIGVFNEYNVGLHTRSLYRDFPIEYQHYYDDIWLRAIPHNKGVPVRLRFMRPDMEDRIFLAKSLEDCERVMKFAEEKTAHLAEEPWRLSGTGVYVVFADWRLLDGCWENPSADFILREEAFAYARSLAAAGTEAMILDVRLPTFDKRIETFKPERRPPSPEKSREDTCP